MATRSNIGHLTEAGWEYIYCHWDGYPSSNGRILLENYKDSEKVAALIALGAISYLHENLDDVEAYHRSRGELWENVKPTVVEKDIRGITDFVEQEWGYAWDGEKWWVKACGEGDWVELTQRFIQKH